MRTWRRELEEDLHTRWIEPVIATGVGHRTLLIEDESPAGVLLETVDRTGADPLVVGAKGHGDLADRVLGGVTYRVNHRSHQPVVIVPPDWSEA